MMAAGTGSALAEWISTGQGPAIVQAFNFPDRRKPI
jgi:hypothetical protein